jgi:hypothetical protein
LVLLLSTPGAADDKDQSKPATPRQQYQALLKEYRDMPETLSKAKTAEERQKLVARLHNLPLRFLQLAEKHPNDPVALEALTQTVAAVNSTAFPPGAKTVRGIRP